MEMNSSVRGLDEAMKAIGEAFPNNPREARTILNGGMRRAASRTILAEAKQRALEGDGSGALSEALGIRAQSRRKIQTRRVVGGVEIVPVRGNLKAMALYINHYYTARGRTPKSGMLLSGIRHGHLVEFGTVEMAARPFLWPAARSQFAPYMQRVAEDMKRVIARRVALRNRKAPMSRRARLTGRG